MKMNFLVQTLLYLGFGVLTAVVMKSLIFWDTTPCSPLKVHRRFGGTYYLHLHCRKYDKQETSVKPGGKQSLCFHMGFCFDPEDIFLRNVG
jgi:hypothetical protein